MACSINGLTEHLPGPHHTVKVVEDCPRGRPQRTLAPPPNDLGVEHGANGFLIRRCGANTGNAKILEVYTEFPPLDISIILPIKIKGGSHC